MADMRVKQPKGVKLNHISKIYKDPKTGKDFYAVHDVDLTIEPGTRSEEQSELQSRI